MTLNSYTYNIGLNPDQYVAGTTIKDYIIQLCDTAQIGSVVHNTQSYNTGYNTNGFVLDFSSVFTTVNGDTVTINFVHPVKISVDSTL